MPTGTVTVYDGSTLIATVELTAEDEGRVKVKLPRLCVGEHSIWAKFSGSETVTSSETTPVTVVVW